jgi:hypothetical protein
VTRGSEGYEGIMTAAVDLEQRLDELFATTPEAFVATRESLVHDLRHEGRRDDAAAVHAFRRPTMGVWSINQMARSRPDQVAALIAVGAEIEALQPAGPDARDEMRAASRVRRSLLDELAQVSASLTPRPDAVRAIVAATLDGASLDPGLQRDLVRGRLTNELSPAIRFLGDDDEHEPPRQARIPKTVPPRDDLAARRTATVLTEARARAAEVDDEVRDAEAASRDAQDTLAAAQGRATALEAALVEARAAVTDARRRVTESQRAEAKARSTQSRAQAALQVAERRAQESGNK